MNGNRTLYCGDAQRAALNRQRLDAKSKQAREVSSRIRSFYEDGLPFFTKETLRDLQEQIKSDNQLISLRGLDGSVRDIEVETGRTIAGASFGDDANDFVLCVNTSWTASS